MLEPQDLTSSGESGGSHESIPMQELDSIRRIPTSNVQLASKSLIDKLVELLLGLRAGLPTERGILLDFNNVAITVRVWFEYFSEVARHPEATDVTMRSDIYDLLIEILTDANDLVSGLIQAFASCQDNAPHDPEQENRILFVHDTLENTRRMTDCLNQVTDTLAQERPRGMIRKGKAAITRDLRTRHSEPELDGPIGGSGGKTSALNEQIVYRGPQQESLLSSPPAPPNPNTGQHPLPFDTTFDHLSDETLLIRHPRSDITTLSALGALRTLQVALGTLVDSASELPSTPPVSRPATPTPDRTVGAKASGTPYVGADADPPHVQRASIARRFYAKTAPPFSISAYASRQHQYCPRSPGVYFAAACYVARICLVESLLPVNNRTVHRLFLACTRIAEKSLEDRIWSQERVAQVGGVSRTQMLNLEIAVCFLLDFELGINMEQVASGMFMLQHGIQTSGL